MASKIIEEQTMRSMSECRVKLDIVEGHLFLLQYIKVHRLKQSRCMGQCSEPQAISETRLSTMSVFRGFPCE